MPYNHRLISLLVSGVVLLPSAQSMAEGTSMNRASSMELPSLEVISTTPLPGIGISKDRYAGNIQTLSAEDIENQNAAEISETLFRNLGSIDINSAQNNPYQNDVHYRGFLASPLVGSAVGISTYVDGVRVNEGFGDTVNWDLIPDFAMANIAVIPGSNPLFGLNTLGGALAIQTKSGFNFQGTEFELSKGHDGRQQATIQHGGNSGNFDWYVGGTKFIEDGWRKNSPSDVKQFFAKVGWESDTTDLDFSYTHADNDLIGNGFVAESTLDARGYDAIHSFPDQTENSLNQYNLNGSHWISDNTLVSANAFYREYERKTLNGDVELGCAGEFTNGAGDEIEAPMFTDGTAEHRVHLSNCSLASIAALHPDARIGSRSRVLFDEATHELEIEIEGEERRTSTETDTWGGTLQFTHDHEISGMENQWAVGLSYDKADTDFVSIEAEEGDVDLSNGSIVPGTVEDAEVGVDITTERSNYSLSFSDILSISDSTTLMLAGRYQHSEVKINNHNPGDEALEGDHSFSRLSPSIGLSHNLQNNITLYGTYNESFRTPTAAELTCADPNDPCKLPNSFVADPPLDPVIGKTIELGARGALNVANLNWSVAVFRTQLKDDLLFTAANNDGGGFFVNVDETQRQGLELGLDGSANKLRWFANYSFIDATFESSETVSSVIDPNGVSIKSGDSLPAIPRHNVKLGLDYAGSTYMRGDEGNDLSKIDGYTVFNVNATFSPNKVIQLWAKVDNVFDSEYENSGIRNFNFYNVPEDGEANIQEERFVSPGAPRSLWAGIKVRF